MFRYFTLRKDARRIADDVLKFYLHHDCDDDTEQYKETIISVIRVWDIMRIDALVTHDNVAHAVIQQAEDFAISSGVVLSLRLITIVVIRVILETRFGIISEQEGHAIALIAYSIIPEHY